LPALIKIQNRRRAKRSNKKNPSLKTSVTGALGLLCKPQKIIKSFMRLRLRLFRARSLLFKEGLKRRFFCTLGWVWQKGARLLVTKATTKSFEVGKTSPVQIRSQTKPEACWVWL
jgi:hypothetical protein